MKKHLLLVVMALCGSWAMAQTVPNGDFETWKSVNGGELPTGWSLSGGVAKLTTSSNPAPYMGSYALLLQNVVANGSGIPGIATNKFAFTNRPTSLRCQAGWYPKTATEGITVLVYLTKWNSGTNSADTVGVGGGSVVPGVTAAAWFELMANITYKTSDAPDTANVMFFAFAGGSFTTGTSLTLDQVAFSDWSAGTAPIAIQPLNSITTYPNPVTEGYTRIQYDLVVASPILIEVMDLQGRRVFSQNEGILAAGQHISQLDMNNLTPGVYLVRIGSGDMVQTQKVVITR